MPDKPDPNAEGRPEVPTRSDLAATTYGDPGYTARTADRLTPDEENTFPKLEIVDPNDKTPPPPEDDKFKRDSDGRITRANTPWGQEDITYSKDFPDTVNTLTHNGPDGPHVYTRNKDGTYGDDRGNVYKDIQVDQKTGDITFSRMDGSKNVQHGNGDSTEFDKNGRATYHLDRANNRSQEYEYDPVTGTMTGFTETDLRTGAKSSVRSATKDAHGSAGPGAEQNPRHDEP